LKLSNTENALTYSVVSLKEMNISQDEVLTWNSNIEMADRYAAYLTTGYIDSTSSLIIICKPLNQDWMVFSKNKRASSRTSSVTITGRSIHFETISIDFFSINDWSKSDDFHINLSHIHRRYCYNILGLNKQIFGNKTRISSKGT
jgi:hypothetical protein